MLAVIRATLQGNPGSAWSDATVRAMMDPNVRFSLAEYWTRTSFGSADVRYTLFPAIAYADPREGKVHGDARQALVETALAEVSRQFDPDWDLFTEALILFEHTVDMFGGGSYKLPTRPGSDRASITAAIVDVASEFGTMCQELGHAYGYQHELGGLSADEYGSPYSAMSAARWPNLWQRPADPNYTNLPAGAVGRDEPLRSVGPYITPSQFVVANIGTLLHPESVVQAPADYQDRPWPLRLTALDHAIAAWPSRRPVVAVLPPLSDGARTYYLEVRRKQDYDQGIQIGLTNASKAGLVIHSFDPLSKRVCYEGVFPFTDNMGDTDFRSFNGRFIVRLVAYDDAKGEASLRVYGGDSGRTFGVDFEGPHVDERPTYGDWKSVEATPCVASSTGIYQCREVQTVTDVSVQAVSYGFEKPAYRWFINDSALDGNAGTLALQVQGKKLGKNKVIDAGQVECVISYARTENRLRLTVTSPFAAMPLELKVIASETSPEVDKAVYPDRTVSTNFLVDNVRLEWDSRYTQALVQCWRRYWQEDKGFGPGQVKPKFDREPQYDPRIVSPEAPLQFNNGVGLTVNPGTLTGQQLVDEVRRVDHYLADVLSVRLGGRIRPGG